MISRLSKFGLAFGIVLDFCSLQGVFSFKRSKGNKRKVCGISSLDYWSEVEDEDIKEVNYKNYVKCWQMVTNILNVSIQKI